MVKFSDSKGFEDIYRKKDDKWLLISKHIWDIVWFEDSKRFYDIYRRKDDK